MKEFRAASLFVREWGSEGAPVALYWDGLGGCGLHANEIAPILIEEHGLRVIAPDAPGHGRSPVLAPEGFRPSALARLAGELLTSLGVSRAAFIGFSWGARVGCSFAADFPERTESLVLLEGGIFLPESDHVDLGRCIAEARGEVEEETFESWESFFAFERESLGRWTPALEEAHRAVMHEHAGRVLPILDVESLGAIAYGERLEPVTETYPGIAGSKVPVLLLIAPRPTLGLESTPVTRFRAALPDAQIETVEGGIHDVVSHAPREVARLVGEFVAAQASARTKRP